MKEMENRKFGEEIAYQSPQTRKVWMELSLVLCRKVGGIRLLRSHLWKEGG